LDTGPDPDSQQAGRTELFIPTPFQVLLVCHFPLSLRLSLQLVILSPSVANMPSTNRNPKSSKMILSSIFLFSLVPIAIAINPSEMPQYNIRRRSGSPDRPAHFGPYTKRDGGLPLKITNACAETIWPGIGTQAGTGAGTGGFELAVGVSKDLTVSSDWQGRVWGRTNCSFNALGTGASNLNGNNGGGRACDSGDCGGVLSCVLTVSTFHGTHLKQY